MLIRTLNAFSAMRNVDMIAMLIVVFAALQTTYSDDLTTAPYGYHQPIYNGILCHNTSFLPNCHELYPRLCIGGSDCVLWESGTFAVRISPNNSVAVESKRSVNDSLKSKCFSEPLMSRSCKTFRGGRFFNGKWAKKDCDFPIQYGSDFRKRLAGRHIVLIGNSMLRQVFYRLVWHCREIDEIIEHFFHTDAFYAFNSTHDYLGIGRNYSASSSDLLNPMFIIDFIWDSTGYYLENPHETNADLRVIGSTYFNFVAQKVINQMRNISNESTLFMTMPIVNWKPRRKNVIRGNLSQINTWIESENIYHLPLSEMADTHVFGKNVLDDLHFQCSFMSLSDKQVDYNIKMPASGDCRDIMNLNVVMMLTYYLQFLSCNTTQSPPHPSPR